ncbi:MAG: ABC transporter ATP-binding protein [Alphaproteobacteria bacterium]|nr:ABC transporter ATP-binding protein [Alphaproteobacteria bacterium]
MSALLEIEGLEVRLPVAGGELHAVRGIDLRLEAGEALSVVGESGCGKSLTALAVMGLLPRRAVRAARRIVFDGQRLDALGERAMADLRGRRLAMIFQDPMTSLNPTLTIGTQLTEGIRRHEGIGAAAARARAVELLERVGIAEPAARLGQYPHQFSGGQRQRVMIAAALMGRPSLLIADEPTTALDVTIQAQILDLLDDLRREFGLAVLLITHDLGVVARFADRVAVMYAGEVVEEAPAAAIFAAPRHPYTRALLAALPVPGRTKPGSRLAAIGGRVPELVGGMAGCAFRDRCPEAVAACARDPVPQHRPTGDHLYRCVVAPERQPARAP